MNEENKDVDLYKELEDTLKKSEEEDTSGADTEKTKDEVDTSKKEVDDGADLSEEEISKLTPRAQKRIREQAEKIKELTAKEIADKKGDKEIVPDSKDLNFKDVNEFLEAVQDAPSRELLRNFYKLVKGETSTILAPIEAKNNEAKFDSVFSKYEKVEGLADYKDDLRKTFLRDPSQDIDALFSKTVTNIVLAKVKPIEKKPSEVNREGEIDIDGLSKDDLYSKLESMRGQ